MARIITTFAFQKREGNLGFVHNFHPQEILAPFCEATLMQTGYQMKARKLLLTFFFSRVKLYNCVSFKTHSFITGVQMSALLKSNADI